MPEWWTYTLSDFLMFSPRTYYRMLERHNAAVWPGQIVALGLGLAVLALLRRPSARQGRILSGVVAVLWAWIAWAFLWKRYATINWPATYFAWGFAIEVLLVGWIGVARGRLSFRLQRDPAGVFGIALFIVAVAVYPLLAPLFGRTWQQAEIFGIAPDPTVLATLGLLLLTPGRPHWELLAVPILWCLVSGATLLAMGSPDAWVLPLAGVFAAAASAWSAIEQRRSALTGVARERSSM